MKKRICQQCKKYKEPWQFCVKADGKKRSLCKECYNAEQRARYAARKRYNKNKPHECTKETLIAWTKREKDTNVLLGSICGVCKKTYRGRFLDKRKEAVPMNV